MNAWDLFTWLSIAVLTGGSVLVFGWFLRDLLRLYRRRGPGSAARPERAAAAPDRPDAA